MGIPLSQGFHSEHIYDNWYRLLGAMAYRYRVRESSGREAASRLSVVIPVTTGNQDKPFAES